MAAAIHAQASPAAQVPPPTSAGKASSVDPVVVAPAMAALTDFDGIGEAIAQRIVKEFGSEAAFIEAASNAEVDRIAAVEGISTRKAVEIVLRVRGVEPLDFLRTPRAETLYEDVIARIREFANTDHARNRLALLVPRTDRKSLEAHVDRVLEARDVVAALPRDEIAKLLRRVAKPRMPRPKFDASVAVLVDTEADSEALAKIGLDRYCRVLTPEDSSFNDGFDVVVYAYSTGALDLAGVENVVSVPFQRDPAAILPQAALQYFRENRPLFETVAALAAVLGWRTVAPDALVVLDRVGARDVDFDAVEALARKVAEDMNSDVKARMQSVSLSGDEVLALMSGRPPRKVLDLQADVLRAGRDRLLRETGQSLHVFADGFPVTVDEDALEKARAEFVSRAKRAAFREQAEAARRLAALKGALDAEVLRLLEFDYEFALGRFALEYGLSKPRFGKGFALEGALHLNLVRQGGTPIDYSIGTTKGENVVLLTGANSGGKTTLLETVAQVGLLAQLGLPVNARKATVEVVDGLYFFTQKRSLDAGAFESFLRGFIPIVTSPSKKLVLADELEAMTELDAASRIVGTFIEMLHASGSLGVCVSHMADEVSKHTTVRIDGIEAKGLDDDFNLVVDRTPRMGYRARSTPELILRKLANRAEGPEKRVYEAILRKFGSDSAR